MNKEFEIYPSEGESLFFVEFSRWEGKPLEYRLFQRHFFYTKEEFNKMLKETDSAALLMMGREGHPYQLLSGEVVDSKYISFNTKEFLEFTVDSLNKNSNAN